MSTVATPAASVPVWRGLLPTLIRQELKSRFVGSMLGMGWALLQPLLLMALYSVLLVSVFHARFPDVSDQATLAYVAAGLFPWLLFAEGSSRACNVVASHAALLGKIKVPLEWFVVANVLATLLLTLIGFVLAYGILLLQNAPIRPIAALACLAVLTLQSLAVCGFALLLAALQVFLRDTALIFGQALNFLFFLTPVLYAPAQLPGFLRTPLLLNPLTTYIEWCRHLVLGTPCPSALQAVVAVAVLSSLLLLGWWSFRRLAPHFEDYL
jgi:lipopolysaccharide transport system permease protein